MTLSHEDLQAISNIMDRKLEPIKTEMAEFRQELKDFRQELNELKQEVNQLKQEVSELRGRVDNIEKGLAETKMHLENETDKNIQLIAENFIDLSNKLNQAIPVADKNLAYEVKVNYLIREVEILKKEVKELKEKTA